MSNRRHSRIVVMQTLYELDINSELTSATLDYANSYLNNNIALYEESVPDKVFSIELLKSVIERLSTLDDIIRKAAPEWPLEKINIIDRNIIRIGLSELLFSDKNDVPPKVAIDESIEVAKSYSGDNSGKFVNGVLGAVYKEMGYGNQAPVKKDLPREIKVGTIIFTKKDNVNYISLVHDVFSNWTLSKGSVKEGENYEDASRRIVYEELGLSILDVKEFDNNEYIAHHPEKGKLIKVVKYFVANIEYADIKLNTEKEGLKEAKWVDVKDINNYTIYKDLKPIIKRAIESIVNIN